MAKSLGILELNDYQLQLSLLDDHGLTVPVNSCGYASIDGQQKAIKFGQHAQQQFRRQPQNSYNQYWNQLNVDPINTNHNKLRHFADFAYQQLLDLHQQANFEQLILVVPASFNHEKLSLLLGICSQCPFEVIGLVDSAVLGTHHLSGGNKDLHLDIQLHQCLLTQLTDVEPSQSQLAYTQVSNADIIPGTGISQLYAKLAHYLSEQFIEQCRFDPKHNAQSEQKLYNLLEQLLNTDKSQELQLSLEGKQITLNRQSIWRHVSDLFDELLSTIEKSAPWDNLYIHQRITTIDSLYQRLTEQFAGKIQIIEQPSIASNLIKCQTQIQINDQGLQYTTSLIKDGPTANAANIRASHLLIGQQAYPLTEQTLYIGTNSVTTEPQSNSLIAINREQTLGILNRNNSDKIDINGQTASLNQNLNLGDTLQIDGQPAMLINVLNQVPATGQH